MTCREFCAKNAMALEIVVLRPEPPFTRVSGPSRPKIAKNISKRVFLGICKEVPENTPKSQRIHQKSNCVSFLGCCKRGCVKGGVILRFCVCSLLSAFARGVCKNQKPGDHPIFRKNALGVKRPLSELWERSGVFSEQLSEFRK